jgi:hypothetical protein
MSGRCQQTNLESGAIFKLYTATSITADTDLSIDYPGYSATGKQEKLPRWVEYAGGDLKIEDAQGNQTTLPAVNAAARPMAPQKIIDVGTTATFIFVIW